MYLLIIGFAILFLFAGHYFKMSRWKQFVEIYEQPDDRALLQSLALGYVANFFLPLRLGDIARSIIAGRKMKNGVSFSFATVAIDRYFDVIVVGLIYFIMFLFGNREHIDSILLYSTLSVVLILFSILFTRYSKYPKLLIKKVGGIFNKDIELKFYMLSWSFISSIKDVFTKLNKKRLVYNTCIMWLFYLLSYSLLGYALFTTGTNIGFSDVFSMLFSRSNIDLSTLDIFSTEGSILGDFPFVFACYILSPLLLLVISSLFIRADKSDSDGEMMRLNLLPQINNQDRLHFLQDYFLENGKEYLSIYLEMNRQINIIQDFSAGSNATTMLCTDGDKTFYRKYAYGADGEKLFEQLQWMEQHHSELPLAEIVHEQVGNGYCLYDMHYDSKAVGLFNYAHSVPIEKSWGVVHSVLQDLENRLYIPYQKPHDPEKLKRYIESKILNNIEKIEKAKEIRPLLEYDTIVINGTAYKNLAHFLKYFTYDHLYDIFCTDTVTDIHGDLTIENIICWQGDEGGYYIIDPNTGNLHDSANLDYGKLLQSLHGKYEFLMKTQSLTVEGNRLDFIFTSSSVYDNLYSQYCQYLFNTFPYERVRSIFYHEIVHWLRLMPYKINKNGKRALLFYAGLIIVLNDIEKMFHDENE